MTKTWLGLSIVGGSVLMLAASALADFQAGVDAAKRGDYEAALKEFRPLAEQGYPLAQATLGLMYAEGEGVAQDYQEAAKWFSRAAEQGIVRAQVNLGFMYVNGQGVAKDDQEAVRLFRLAAEQGDAMAQSNLGLMYYKGQGVQKDSIQAYMWVSLAVEQRLEQAKEWVEVLEKEMTPAQIAEAQRLAREWKAKGK